MSGKFIDNVELAEKVKALRERGMTKDAIAVELKIVQSTVGAILRQVRPWRPSGEREKASAMRRCAGRIAARASVSSRLAEKQLNSFGDQCPDALPLVVITCCATLRLLPHRRHRRLASEAVFQSLRVYDNRLFERHISKRFPVADTTRAWSRP